MKHFIYNTLIYNKLGAVSSETKGLKQKQNETH